MLSPMRWMLAALALALGCSRGAESPEDQVRRVFAALEAAAEARDVGALKAHVSESYKDAQGNDRRAVLGLATAHFMRNSSVYVFARIGEVEIAEPGTARAEALVALAGTPIRDAAALPELHADLYRFDVTLRDEGGEWRVTAAEWQPASAADFK